MRPPWWRGGREHVRELDSVLRLAHSVVEAEVSSVRRGRLVCRDVRVGEDVDVDGDEDAVVVHVGGALEVRVRGGEARRRPGDEAGVDGHHVDAPVHGQRPRRLLRQRLGHCVPQLCNMFSQKYSTYVVIKRQCPGPACNNIT
jgi:hypothetical protein